MSNEERREEIFDSLPYYDNDLESFPILKQKVEQELARESKPPATLHPRVPPPPRLFVVRRIFVSVAVYTHPLLGAEQPSVGG